MRIRRYPYPSTASARYDQGMTHSPLDVSPETHSVRKPTTLPRELSIYSVPGSRYVRKLGRLRGPRQQAQAEPIRLTVLADCRSSCTPSCPAISTGPLPSSPPPSLTSLTSSSQIAQLQRCEPITEEEVKQLCLKAREILIEEGNVQVVDSPVTVRRIIVGPMHRY